MAEKDGDYCTICGGVVSGDREIRQIMVDGKPVGISRLDFIIDEVLKIGEMSEQDAKEELMKRACQFNYIPTKKKESYADALFSEYLNKA
ncbi:NAC family transcription factor [Methanoplanus sp. FWC-SCC4]|uniref:NAC family transcription factor n=1 Tax=Methanochimaera problematica TaxID=2609417 RepID=A0AA97FCD0_9EURY|nr:NAC family transcription factor [Methanoplanus sp. FWC-SCC4]WOF16885.1 NAC family transcription factor [Methanoplanus sp. FWC-SCC4]